jgi:hypothetical protein
MARFHAVVLCAICLAAATAKAQNPGQTVTLVPLGAPRWDAAAHVTWLGEQRRFESDPGDRWFGVAAGGGIVGYHWTPHLRTELDISTAAEGELYSYEAVFLPGATTPVFVQRDHEFRVTTASAGLAGQFFENAWFHPFVGTGIELVHEREGIETAFSPFSPRDPRAIGLPPQSETQRRYRARPFVATGFKAYVSERAFILPTIRSFALSRERLDRVSAKPLQSEWRPASARSSESWHCWWRRWAIKEHR